MAKGLLSDPGKKQQKPNRGRQEQRQNQRDQKLVANQQKGVIKNQGQGLQDLTGFNNEQFKGVQNSYSQPFDLSSIGDVPQVDQGYMDQMRDSYLKQYDYANAENDKRAQSDFEQMAGERGWTPGSEVYNTQKELLLKGQRSARDNAVNSAIQNAGAEGQRFFDMQMQGYDTKRDNYVATRDRPFQEYSATAGVINQNPLWGQWSQNSQQQFQGQQAALDRNQAMKIANMSRGGGGGGGGGGAAWQQYGFSSPQEYDQYKLDQGLKGKEAELQLAQKYGPKQNSVSPWAQLGGGILGSFANGFASNLGKGIFS